MDALTHVDLEMWSRQEMRLEFFKMKPYDGEFHKGDKSSLEDKTLGSELI